MGALVHIDSPFGNLQCRLGTVDTNGPRGRESNGNKAVARSAFLEDGRRRDSREGRGSPEAPHLSGVERFGMRRWRF